MLQLEDVAMGSWIEELQVLQNSATGLQREAVLGEYNSLFCGRADETGVSNASKGISNDTQTVTARCYCLRLKLEDGTGGREG